MDESHSKPQQASAAGGGGASTALYPKPTSAKDDATYAKTVQINNEISKFAARKDLGSALALYEEALAGGYYNTHTFCSVINAYVRCGSVSDAVIVMAEMKRRRYKPDVVPFTTLMKGFCNDSDIVKAYSLFREMELTQPKVIPNIRTVNTFLRGCVSTGELLLAEKVFLQCKEWNVTADISTYEYLGQLYCQSLNLDKVLPLLGRISKDPASAIGLAVISINAARTKAVLGDWKGSRKGLSAALEYIKIDESYDGAAAVASAEDDGDEGGAREKKPSAVVAAVTTSASTAGGGKRAWHTKEDADNSRKESLDRFRVHRRNELRHDADLLEAFINKSTSSSSSSSSAVAGTVNADSTEAKLIAAAKVLPMIARTLCFFKLSKPVDDKKQKKKKGASSSDKSKDKAAESIPVIQTISRDDCDADVIAKLEANMVAEARLEELRIENENQAELERVDGIKQNILDTFSDRLGMSVLLKHLEKLTSSPPSVSQQVMKMLDALIASCVSAAGKFDFNKFDSLILNDFTSNAIALYSKIKIPSLSMPTTSASAAVAVAVAVANEMATEEDEKKQEKKEKKEKKKEKKERKDSKRDSEGGEGGDEVRMDTDDINASDANKQQHHRPLKLEICSGAGEWAVAQATEDRHSHWMTMELRFDRAHQTLNKAMYANLDNLTVLCGDANDVIRNNILDGSIHQVFINHPEPPQQTSHSLESQGKHLLTKKFFNEVFRILQPEGTLTIVTDNNWYAKYLLRQFSTTAYPREFQSISLQAAATSSISSSSSSSSTSSSSKEWSHVESEGGIDLYEGRPGSNCGHIVDASSYFDRLWKGEKITERYFFFLRKQRVAVGALGPQGSIKPKIAIVVGGGGGGGPFSGGGGGGRGGNSNNGSSNNSNSSFRDRGGKDSNSNSSFKKRPFPADDNHRNNNKNSNRGGSSNSNNNSNSNSSSNSRNSSSSAGHSSLPPPPVARPTVAQEPAVLNIRGRFKGTALTVDSTSVQTKKIKFDEDE